MKNSLKSEKVEKEEYFLSEIFKYLKLVIKPKVKSSWYAESFNELHGGKFKKYLKPCEWLVWEKNHQNLTIFSRILRADVLEDYIICVWWAEGCESFL